MLFAGYSPVIFHLDGSAVPFDLPRLNGVDISDFNYLLPPDLIAQVPANQRDQSRLLVLHRAAGSRYHRQFTDLPEYLRPGDVLVLNNSRVIPARLRSVKPDTQARLEVFLLDEMAPDDWWVLLRPGKRARPGTHLVLLDRLGRRSDIHATVTDKNTEGHFRVRFARGQPAAAAPPAGSKALNLRECLADLGEVPLPPYIVRPQNILDINDIERYQTVYAQPPGSVAAPTAGLHFTRELLAALPAQGVQLAFVTLHVGPGTFAPVKAGAMAKNALHEERYSLDAAAAQTLNAARRDGRRIIAVGTTSVRVLETVARQTPGEWVPQTGRTDIFIHPPYPFRAVDALLTNFHLPQSSLLMLVCAFATPGRMEGRAAVLDAYAEAIRRRYRFFSYGDAMLLL
jgi:S-adenosylmethionine:tRNA ribosyltransferase-isomerase